MANSGLRHLEWRATHIDDDLHEFYGMGRVAARRLASISTVLP
jgi:hypothetical protein